MCLAASDAGMRSSAADDTMDNKNNNKKGRPPDILGSVTLMWWRISKTSPGAKFSDKVGVFFFSLGFRKVLVRSRVACGKYGAAVHAYLRSGVGVGGGSLLFLLLVTGDQEFGCVRMTGGLTSHLLKKNCYCGDQKHFHMLVRRCDDARGLRVVLELVSVLHW